MKRKAFLETHMYSTNYIHIPRLARIIYSRALLNVNSLNNIYNEPRRSKCVI